jgi:hypothetical protein
MQTFEELKVAAREYFIHGGGGHEDGEDGARAVSFSFDGMVEMAAAFAEQEIAARVAEFAERAAEHRVLPSDLVAHFGICSCQKEGEMPVDFETEQDYIDHLRAILPSPARAMEAREADWKAQLDSLTKHSKSLLEHNFALEQELAELRAKRESTND